MARRYEATDEERERIKGYIPKAGSTELEVIEMEKNETLECRTKKAQLVGIQNSMGVTDVALGGLRAPFFS